MNYEKSCGAIVFRQQDKLEYLIIFNKKGNAQGHWGFPKGHTEGNESEHETAIREIMEETGLKPYFVDGFRVVSTYSPKDGVIKDAVYFLAESKSGNVKIQTSELADYRWLEFEAALELLTFDKKYLVAANDYLTHLYESLPVQ